MFLLKGVAQKSKYEKKDLKDDDYSYLRRLASKVYDENRKEEEMKGKYSDKSSDKSIEKQVIRHFRDQWERAKLIGEDIEGIKGEFRKFRSKQLENERLIRRALNIKKPSDDKPKGKEKTDSKTASTDSSKS